MTTIKSKYLVVLVLFLFGFSSCEQYFGDTNVDPDNPLEVPPSASLPAAQVRLAFMVGGDASRISSVLTQHVQGTARQFAVIQNYGFTGTDVNALWNNAYSGVLQDLKRVRMSAAQINSNHHIGIAHILEAYTLLLVTDLFGDIPWTEALQGLDNLNPTFDTQESIYNAVFEKIDQGIASLALDPGLTPPTSDDIIYGGDVARWNEFAYTLRARAFLHLGLVDNSNYTKALTALMNGFSNSTSDGKLAFETSSNNAPWFQFNIERGDIEINANYVTLLTGFNDPRLSLFNNPFDGNASHPYFTPNQAQPLLTYTEAKFIEAEARMQTEGATAATHQAYLDAIASSFAETGYSADYATYIAQPSVDPGSAALTLNEIITQKHIALFTSHEVYNDWRRTGIPALTPNSGTEVPTRFPYPNAEIQYNPNAPTTATLFDKLWWDR